MQRNGRMAIGAGIEQYRGGLVIGLVQPVDQDALVIGLAEIDGKAQSLAGRIVYREGIDFVEPMPSVAIAEFALVYLRQESVNRALVAEVNASNLPDRERIAAILERAGTRAALVE